MSEIIDGPPGSDTAAALIRVGVTGAAGRMGRTVCDAVDAAEDMELIARIDPALGTTLAEFLTEVDVVVDFTRPDVALENVKACLAAGVHVVVGTSSWDVSAVEGLSGANVLFCPNFSLGAVLMMRFAVEASKHMAKAEIIELHHDRKLDAPSGTAQRTADQMQGDVPVHSVRLPGLVAHQEVIFGGVGETLTIRHDSLDRSSFMPGVLLAVRRVAGLTSSPVIGLEHVLFES